MSVCEGPFVELEHLPSRLQERSVMEVKPNSETLAVCRPGLGTLGTLLIRDNIDDLEGLLEKKASKGV